MLNETLKKLRVKCGYTQQDMANVLKIDRSTYTYYETGKTSPSIKTIVKLKHVFNVDYDYLLEGDPSKIDAVAEKKTSYKKKGESLYDLDKKERTMLLNFRLLSDEKKEEAIKLLSDLRD
ncbi:MAG: helix-turn-helix domain-containing protein [Clostridia bacterium]|nr:helix-turn-helix domain-containing protein [Clostridia bacterium]